MSHRGGDTQRAELHMLHVREQEVETLRAELDERDALIEERDALIEELRRDLGAARKALLGYHLVTTREQTAAAQQIAGVFLDVLRRRATQDDAA